MNGDKQEADEKAAGGAEAGMGGAAGAGRRGQGNTLKDASDEAVRELEKRKDSAGHAGTGDYG